MRKRPFISGLKHKLLRSTYACYIGVETWNRQGLVRTTPYHATRVKMTARVIYNQI